MTTRQQAHLDILDEITCAVDHLKQIATHLKKVNELSEGMVEDEEGDDLHDVISEILNSIQHDKPSKRKRGV